MNEFEFLDSYAAWFFNNINTWGLLSFQYITDISRWTKAMSLNLRHDVCKNNLWLNMMMIEPTYFPPIFSCYTKRNIFLQLLDSWNTKRTLFIFTVFSFHFATVNWGTKNLSSLLNNYALYLKLLHLCGIKYILWKYI